MEAQENKGQLTYATNGNPIPGPAGFKAYKKNGPDEIEGEEVDTENGKAKPAKKLNKEEKQEAEEIKEHPEKECESPPGEEETKQQKVNEPADKPRKKKAAAAEKIQEVDHMNCLFQKSLKDKVYVNRCVLDSVLWFHVECPIAAGKFDDPNEFKKFSSLIF